jgi:RNA polymerase sigma-70 factor (ECF subfamily)
MSADPSEETSPSLIDRLHSGDAAAWHRLTHLYGPLVRFWCRRMGVGAADLDDLTQEVWLSLGPTLAGYCRIPGRSFRGFLRTVAHHRAQDWHRRRSLRVAEAEGGSDVADRLNNVRDQAAADADPDEAAESRALYRRVLALLEGEFEERTWKAFLGVVIAEKPAAEVGAELGMTAAAVRMARSRVLSRLRSELVDPIE